MQVRGGASLNLCRVVRVWARANSNKIFNNLKRGGAVAGLKNSAEISPLMERISLLTRLDSRKTHLIKLLHLSKKIILDISLGFIFSTNLKIIIVSTITIKG